MSLFVPLADGIQVELRYHLANRILTNRLWFVVVAGGPTTADLIAVANGVKSWWIASLQPLLSRDLHLISIRTYDATIAYPSAFQVATVGLGGGFADDSYSANVAIKVSFKVENPPGEWLNWNFVAGIPRSAVSLNTIDPTYANNLKNAYADLIDQFSLFVYRWEATRAVVDNVTLSTRDHFRVDIILCRSPYVSQRRKRLTNPP